MHTLNKLRPFTEYHDMITSTEDLVASESKIIKNLEIAYSKKYSNFVNSIPTEFQEPYNKIGIYGQKTIDTYKDEHKSIEPLPHDMTIFINQLKDINTLKKKAENANEDYEISREEEKKLHDIIKSAKSKGDYIRVEQHMAKFKDVKKETSDLRKKSKELNDEYKEESGKFKITFAAMMSSIIVYICEARKRNIDARRKLADNILESASKIKSEDPEIEELKKFQLELEKDQ